MHMQCLHMCATLWNPVAEEGQSFPELECSKLKDACTMFMHVSFNWECFH